MTDTPIPTATDPTTAASLGLLRQVLLAVGVLLTGHGIIGPNNTITPDNWEFLVGILVTIAPVAWSWWEKFHQAKTAKDREAIAVQAGINLVARGAAIATDGSLIQTDGKAPLPVTAATVPSIIKNFAPTPPGSDERAVTDALNTAQLKNGGGL